MPGWFSGLSIQLHLRSCSSGGDLRIGELEPHIDLSWEPAWDCLSPSFSAPPPLACALCLSLSLKINKLFKKALFREKSYTIKFILIKFTLQGT